jgi:hypothetical protein
MASISRVGAAKAALKTAIAAQLVTDGHTADVRLFPLIGDTNTRENRIWFDVARPDQEHHTFGGSRLETIELDGVINAWVSGVDETDQTTAETDSLNLLSSIETTLRTDDTLGDVVHHAELVEFTITPQIAATGDMVVSNIEFTLSIQSFLD